jgi:hypothetical protein
MISSKNEAPGRNSLVRSLEDNDMENHTVYNSVFNLAQEFFLMQAYMAME